MKEVYATAQRLGAYLEAKHFTVTTAESCTGGGVAHAITAVPGSSHWFEAGWITYSNKVKTELLGVDASLIETKGAVSAEVVAAMATGALAASDAHCAIAISGVAGPDGGTDDKPVGTVWIAWLAKGQAVRAEECRFSGGREAIRQQTIPVALEGLLDYLANKSDIS